MTFRHFFIATAIVFTALAPASFATRTVKFLYHANASQTQLSVNITNISAATQNQSVTVTYEATGLPSITPSGNYPIPPNPAGNAFTCVAQTCSLAVPTVLQPGQSFTSEVTIGAVFPLTSNNKFLVTISVTEAKGAVLASVYTWRGGAPGFITEHFINGGRPF